MTKYEDLRQCIITWKGKKIPARFHQFCQVDDGDGINVYAIVELEEGQLETHSLSYIQFTDHQIKEVNHE